PLLVEAALRPYLDPRAGDRPAGGGVRDGEIDLQVGVADPLECLHAVAAPHEQGRRDHSEEQLFPPPPCHSRLHHRTINYAPGRQTRSAFWAASRLRNSALAMRREAVRRLTTALAAACSAVAPQARAIRSTSSAFLRPPWAICISPPCR